MPELPVLVAGAGIGGLTAALALARSGHAVTMFERRQEPREEGAGIQLSPNAGRVLGELGLEDRLREVAAEPVRIVVRALASGRTLGKLPLGPHARRRWGAPYRVVRRADLLALLIDAVSRERVILHTGHEVIGAETAASEARLTVRAGAGAQVYSGLFAVAADGLWSRLRRTVGDERDPRFQKFCAWRTTIAIDQAPPMLRGNEIGLWLSPDAHVVHYPVAAGARINVVVLERASETLSGWSTAGDGTALAARFSAAAPQLFQLLAAPSEWRRWSLFDLEPPQRWHHGRVVLLGDAAHPILPFLAQGGALAIEDAAVLAARISAMAEIDAALASYARERRPRAARVAQAARTSGSIFHLAGPLAVARDLALRVPGELLLRRYDWIYGWGSRDPGAPRASGRD